ncbi:MAG: URC4/urg3 family protein [Gemmatimonadota bacterium]|nr:URC4/urg3 family protein [Gemmatimonadota bacterium]
MLHGPPLPLSPDVTLRELLEHRHPPAQLGAWIRGGVRRMYVSEASLRARCSVLASTDLGFLLGRCAEVAVREGNSTIVLPAEAVIEWRALQVATATPYLPGLDRLHAMFPGLRTIHSGFLVPVVKGSAEEVLAQCLEQGIPVRGSRIVYQPMDS